MSVRSEKNFTDGENYEQKMLPIKQFHSERKHTVRKHALGEIKNVMHNQHFATPLKGHQPGPSKSFYTLKKQTKDLKSQVDNRQKCEQSQKVQPIVLNKVEELEKKSVPIPRTCSQMCSKSLEEIWSEMNVLDPSTLERLINGDGDANNDYDVPARNLSPINFRDDFDLGFELENTYDLEEKKFLESLLSKDYDSAHLPLPLDWIDDL